MGSLHNSYSTGDQGFMPVSKSSVYALVLSLFIAINLWHCAITIIYTPRLPHIIYTPLLLEHFFILSNCTNYYGSKAAIHRDAYHNHLIPMLPYKVTVGSVACLWAYQWFELAESLNCRSNLYQRTHVKSVPEK